MATNASAVSRKLQAAGFQRSLWSAVKGRGRSRRTNGFDVTTDYDGNLLVSVKDHREELSEQVFATVTAMGFVEIEAISKSYRRFAATN